MSTIKQNNPAWFNERDKRITGSICYALFTFIKRNHSLDEWKSKLNSIYKSQFKGNEHTIRGQENELKAKQAYEKKNRKKN